MDLSITLILVVANVAISLIAFSNEGFMRKAVFNPYLVVQNNEWHRVLAHAFVHGNLIHLLFNMYVLYQFGQLIETIFTRADAFARLFPTLDFWGASRGQLYFILLYFGGLLAATLPAFRKHSKNPGYNSVGASGAVSAVVLGIIILLPTMSLYLFFIPIPIPAFVIGGAYLVYEYYMSKRMSTRIAHDAHLWGGLFGLVFLLLIQPAFGLFFIRSIAAYIGW